MPAIILLFFWVSFWVAIIVGWVWNIIKVFSMGSFDPLTGEIILRIVGIFVAPLGAVMGYL